MLFLVILTGCEPTTTATTTATASATATTTNATTSMPPAAPEKEPDPPVEVRSMNELGQYYDSIGFNLTTNPGILHAVPRLRFTHVPKNWEGEPSIPLKQSVFFHTMTTMALKVNEEILEQRQKLLKLDMEKPLSTDDQEWLQQMMAQYKV